jgi:hypothetical protein
MRELADAEGLIPVQPTIFRNIVLYGRFLMPRTDSLTAPLLLGKL